jgi:hypothetical protein
MAVETPWNWHYHLEALRLEHTTLLLSRIYTVYVSSKRAMYLQVYKLVRILRI